MQPRPRFPIHGGMGQNPFAGGRQMMGPGPNVFGGRAPMSGPPGGLFGGRGMGMGMGGSQMNRGGGLLAKLFARNNPAGMQAGMMGMQGAGRSAGGLLQSLTNPSGIAGFLNNTQQVIKTAQTVAPMIQQYGPLVKNLPALWKLYRGLKNTPAEDKAGAKATGKEESSDHFSAAVLDEESSSNSGKKQVKPKKTVPKSAPHKGVSTPKLYI